MDFRFTSLQGHIVAQCSMEHIALANWFNTEVRLNSPLISTALAETVKAKNYNGAQETRLIGTEYSLFIRADEVVIKANNLCIADNQERELEQNFHYYDAESIAFCGLEDFEHFLRSYQDFIR
ncbi:hypothetical protein CBG46_00050 [Actinobacillus succinogenes]|uniref:Uncharacterized conserved protein UCP006287 n=1 Tax=Actinobacillus succinogenes (strain ATCC 55618 / DSM 22257 / CCUG 43843 / 130Z) TaxID=339671 RepID=A6VN48_ACTSZ|nr:YacL family protein [Actinobacillus succinogenes]ABR74395.1 uncharacterised conserved protein UCP006287 [Actinobacillus succinogenes 130Z]PHI39184.1 hypothetical protein CBG46_00050 [Actinobacillus succinogenes]